MRTYIRTVKTAEREQIENELRGVFPPRTLHAIAQAVIQRRDRIAEQRALRMLWRFYESNRRRRLIEHASLYTQRLIEERFPESAFSEMEESPTNVSQEGRLYFGGRRFVAL